MKTRILAVAALLLLASCEPQGGHPPEAITTSVALDVYWSTPAEIAAIAAAHGQPPADRDGFAVLRHGVDGLFMCDVYVASPTSLGVTTQQLLGHEVLHCLFGAYHVEP